MTRRDFLGWLFWKAPAVAMVSAEQIKVRPYNAYDLAKAEAFTEAGLWGECLDREMVNDLRLFPGFPVRMSQSAWDNLVGPA